MASASSLGFVGVAAESCSLAACQGLAWMFGSDGGSGSDNGGAVRLMVSVAETVGALECPGSGLSDRSGVSSGACSFSGPLEDGWPMRCTAGREPGCASAIEVGPRSTPQQAMALEIKKARERAFHRPAVPRQI